MSSSSLGVTGIAGELAGVTDFMRGTGEPRKDMAPMRGRRRVDDAAEIDAGN